LGNSWRDLVFVARQSATGRFVAVSDRTKTLPSNGVRRFIVKYHNKPGLIVSQLIGIGRARKDRLRISLVLVDSDA
jgi:hypothetical protein